MNRPVPAGAGTAERTRTMVRRQLPDENTAIRVHVSLAVAIFYGTMTGSGPRGTAARPWADRGQGGPRPTGRCGAESGIRVEAGRPLVWSLPRRCGGALSGCAARVLAGENAFRGWRRYRRLPAGRERAPENPGRQERPCLAPVRSGGSGAVVARCPGFAFRQGRTGPCLSAAAGDVPWAGSRGGGPAGSAGPGRARWCAGRRRWCWPCRAPGR